MEDRLVCKCGADLTEKDSIEVVGDICLVGRYNKKGQVTLRVDWSRTNSVELLCTACRIVEGLLRERPEHTCAWRVSYEKDL
jgi:hypothetical protein